MTQLAFRFWSKILEQTTIIFLSILSNRNQPQGPLWTISMTDPFPTKLWSVVESHRKAASSDPSLSRIMGGTHNIPNRPGLSTVCHGNITDSKPKVCFRQCPGSPLPNPEQTRCVSDDFCCKKYDFFLVFVSIFLTTAIRVLLSDAK